MKPGIEPGPWRILIASSHPLFAEGLRSILHERQQMDAVVVGMVSTVDEALNASGELQPELIIVDYDDEQVNREEFLARFVEGEGRLRVVLLSLKEGGQDAIVYDRRSLAGSQVEDWLKEWTDLRKPEGELPAEEQPTDSPKALRLSAGGDFAEFNSNDHTTRRGMMKHVIAAGLLVVGLIVAGFVALQAVDLLPVSASLQAIPIDDLFRLDFGVIVVLFALIVGLMVYSILVFRRRKGDDTDGPHIEGNMNLEVAWTLIPLGFVLYLAFVGSITLGQVEAADPKPLRVDVTGSQWAWRFDYPDLDITSTELFLPVNKQALLTLSSTDVIHSFWVPEFRVKQDVLPGEDFERELRITPNEIGEYKVTCAEMCGRLHYNMVAPVNVLPQEEFDAWVESMSIPEDPVARGDLWTQQFGCRACHSIDGSPLVGPTWQGIFGSQEQLTDGSSVTVDADYILQSIRDPGTKIVAGFQNLMPPNVGADLTDEQINDIIAFMESLK